MTKTAKIILTAEQAAIVDALRKECGGGAIAARVKKNARKKETVAHAWCVPKKIGIVSLMEQRNTILSAEREWVRLIEKISKSFDGDVIGKAASIVWWDYYSNRDKSIALRDLDGLRAMYRKGSEVHTDKLAACLMAFGYDAKHARKRAHCPVKDSPEAGDA
jgi:hypothetical protein